MGKLFFRGLATLVPLFLTVYLAVWTIIGIESVVKRLALIFVSEEQYSAGAGLLLALALIFAVGILMGSVYSQRLYSWFEERFQNIPLIGTVYGAFKDFFDYFSIQQAEQASQVVVLRPPGSEKRMLGLITSERPQESVPVLEEGLLAVYLPMSYQIGGFTLLVREEDIERIDVPMEQAFKFILTAGVKKKRLQR